MTNILKPEEVIEAMVEFVRAHLELQDRKEKSETQSLVFSGVREERLPKGKTVARRYSLDVVTKVDAAAYPSVWQGRLRARSEAKDKIYTGILLPRSLDYHNADPRFEGPYLRTANLLDGLDKELFEKYEKKFWRTPICILSNLEANIAIPLTNNCVAYYNAKHDMIQTFNLRAFPEWEIIPFNENTPECKLTPYDAWFLLNKNYVPSLGGSDSTKIFVQKENHLHRVVRTKIKKNETKKDFTLSRYKNAKCKYYGTRLVPSNQNQ